MRFQQLVCGALFVLGCGAGSSTGSGTGGSDGVGASSAGGSGPGGGFVEGGGGGTNITDGGGTSAGGGCAGDDYVAEKVPLDLFVMLDQSGSMSDPAAGSGDRWEAVTSALSSFIAQPGSAGIGIGIQYFPLENDLQCEVITCSVAADCGAGCGPCEGAIPGVLPGFCVGYGNTDSCEVADYATPDVEIAVLPGVAGAINASLSSHGPTGGTPTSAALQGALNHASEWATAHPGHRVVVVLATDGEPTTCDTDQGVINNMAATALAANPSISTYVIGVGNLVNVLDQIAAAGGTQEAFIIDQDPDVAQAFLAAMNAIQGEALPCSFQIPEPPEGEMLNFNQVNVSYTPPGAPSQTIPRVDSAAACPAGSLAWYYDVPESPTQIMLCPFACETLSADTEGTVKIVLGCDTVVE